MTRQEIFDLVKTHLLKQNCKSQDQNGTCVYRSPDGRMCAAGPLIQDYSPDLEYKIVLMMPTKCWKLGVAEHLDMVRELQIVHDKCPVETWDSELKKVAGLYNLEIG